MAIELRNLSDGCKIEDSERFMSARINGQGYWCSFRIRDAFYRRCMDGSVVEGASAQPVSEQCSGTVHQAFQSWIDAIPCHNKTIEVSQGLNLENYKEIGSLYRSVYPEDVTILPPDRYGDIVIMPAIGCPNRQCTFCAFYKDKPYKVLKEDMIEQHLTAVKQLYGAKVLSSPGVFLGSANAMALSQRRLMFCLELIKERLGSFNREVATFADPDFSARRSEQNWVELREAGLRHVVVGLETGWKVLRAKLGKSGDLSKCIAFIKGARSAGIGIGLTILTGAASGESREENIKQTIMMINKLALSNKDIIYLSPLSKNENVGIEAIEEQRLIKERLDGMTEAKVVPYQMQRFRYFA
ncbi:radical SAM protein [uncultured Endozoicomonas sp.]|uniref:radical SAM protein n=1 Tax=uncultured Endozoicomonas sp. TaxID=432652 RepID=UPI002605720E|nr:radical SAM protein [uncultured Endozoicomonas sp.]